MQFKMTQKNDIYYPVDNHSKIIKPRPWLANCISFAYDILMDKIVFPKKLESDLNVHCQILKEELKEIHNLNILEIGTGSGAAVNYLDPSNHYTGLDISPGLLQRAVKKFKKAGFKNSQFYVSDGKHIPAKNSYFDLCLCILTLNFFHDIETVLNEIGRVLKDGGLFLGCVPVPERNRNSHKIQGVLRTENELATLFNNHQFNYQIIPISNGILLYFKGTKQDANHL